MIHDITEPLMVQTPEGIRFPLHPASPVTRFIAWVIDWMGITAVMTIAGNVIKIVGFISQDLSAGIYFLAYFVMTFAYYIILEWFWNGQTIGKRLMKLRVMDVQGLNLSFGQIILRNLLRAIDGLPFLYMVGGIAASINQYSQRLGDIAANTAVVRTRTLSRPELSEVLSGKFNSFKAYPHLCRRVQHKVSPAIAEVLLHAVLRRNRLEPEARVRVFKHLADFFKSIVKFPEEAVQGVSDEQYIRNLLEILFRDVKDQSRNIIDF